MIGLKLAVGFLKLYPDTVVELIKNNPLMAEGGKIPGTYTITIEVPNDEEGHNARILGAVNLVENHESLINSEQDATLFFDGVPLEAGRVRIKPGATTSEFNLDFVGGLRAVSRDLKDKKLSEMSWPTVPLHFLDFGTGSSAQVDTEASMASATAAAVSAVHAARQAGHFSLHRYKNPAFSTDPGFQDYVNQVNPSTQEPVPNGVYVKKDFKYQAGVSISPNGGLEVVGAQISVNVNGSLYTSTVASTSLMEKYKELAGQINAAESATGIKVTAVVDQLNFYVNGQGNIQQNGENGHLQIEMVNPLDSTTDLSQISTIESDTNWLETENSKEVRFSNANHYAPTFLVSKITEQIQSEFSVKFTGAIFDEADLQDLAFHTNTTMMVPVSIGDSEIEGSFYAFKKDFNAGDYLPDWTIGQWIRELAFLFSCGVLYDQYTRVIRFVYLSDVIREVGYYDASAQGIRFSKGQPDTNAYSGITLKYATASYNQNAVVSLDAVILGTGEKTLQSNFRAFSHFLNEEDEIKDSPVIMFDNGSGSGQFVASVASSSGTYSLLMTGFLGNELYTKFHKPWLRFLMSRKTLPVEALMELRHHNQTDFRQKVMFDRVKYLHGSIKIRLTMRGIDATELTLYST